METRPGCHGNGVIIPAACEWTVNPARIAYDRRGRADRCSQDIPRLLPAAYVESRNPQIVRGPDQGTAMRTTGLMFVAYDAVPVTTARQYQLPLRGNQSKTAAPDAEVRRPQLPAYTYVRR